MKFGWLKTIDRSLIRIYIFLRASCHKIKMYENVNIVLDKYEYLLKAKHYKLRFTFFYDCTTVQESMCLTRTNSIVANPAWAAKLVLFCDSDADNIFLITVGHEITHTKKEFSYRHFKGASRKFIKWVNELHADFGGAKAMVNSRKGKLLETIDYKIKRKSKTKKWLIKRLILCLIGSSHPSWNQRKEYAQMGVFNAKLIRRIADDTGCDDENLKSEVIKFYGDIVLVDDII